MSFIRAPWPPCLNPKRWCRAGLTVVVHALSLCVARSTWRPSHSLPISPSPALVFGGGEARVVEPCFIVTEGPKSQQPLEIRVPISPNPPLLRSVS